MIAAKQLSPDALLERLETATDIAALQRAIEVCRDSFGVDHMGYHWISAASDNYGVGTYAAAWIKHYIAQDYLRVDPVIQGCYQRFHPVDWKQLDWSGKAARQFLREAIEFGVGSQGYSVPIRGPNGQFALFSANHSCTDADWATFTKANRRPLILIAHAFHQKALEFEPQRSPPQTQALSPREVDALTLLAVGHSRAQVAQTLNISEHTLRAYIESARFKLGASNTIHAVACAMSRGVIVI
ncbi:LuxR family transcriptional regulator [Roseovarius sp. Pro17]|uniref:helix-turn-helix transcriptional regulator n=1 Tax=Roseovarius sp. Pro17 TaxID=3108175 RepID=UPI002D79A1BC|nr:LuxR family transcriptional regulator [Roseovarius sp. Pro17]